MIFFILLLLVDIKEANCTNSDGIQCSNVIMMTSIHFSNVIHHLLHLVVQKFCTNCLFLGQFRVINIC